jgi:hypothetical protein
MVLSSCSTNARRIGCIKRCRLAWRWAPTSVRWNTYRENASFTPGSHVGALSLRRVFPALLKRQPAVKTVRLRGLALLALAMTACSAPRMPGLRGSILVPDTGAETPWSHCTTNSVLPGSSSTSATTAGNQHPSHTHTGSCRLISACDASILSSVPERTAGKIYWQVTLRNIAQRRPESKLRLKTGALALWPWPTGDWIRVRRRRLGALVEPHRRPRLDLSISKTFGGPEPANAPTRAGGHRHKRGTAEQRIEEGKPAGEDGAAYSSLQRGAAVAEDNRLQPGEPVAAAGTAGRDRYRPFGARCTACLLRHPLGCRCASSRLPRRRP